MNFGEALQALKEGKKIVRSGWNDQNKYLDLLPGGGQGDKHLALVTIPNANTNPTPAQTAHAGEPPPPWTPSMDDMFGTDWEIKA